MARAKDDAFTAWIEELKIEARERGISEATLDSALSDLKPIDRVIKLDRQQPEFKLDLSTYLGNTVSTWRILKGRMLLYKHQSLLENVGQRYGIPPRFLVAFWGIESNYGKNSGSFPVISSLATLAYDTRRSDFFRAQLLDALTIVDEGHISLQNLRGSWAGATGQLQFMPSTFTRYALDGDSDGRKDIWNNLPDVMESAANFLASAGWQRGFIWGREVLVPPDLDRSLTGPDNRKPLSEWQALGVRRANGRDLPEEDIEGAVIFPSDAEQPAFLVYDNFSVIMKWNRSSFYAIAVGHLADRIIGKGPLKTLR
jgi:membrane-bound lytic murein transglycosylase B